LLCLDDFGVNLLTGYVILLWGNVMNSSSKGIISQATFSIRMLEVSFSLVKERKACLAGSKKY
jgi:hypothetical protein